MSFPDSHAAQPIPDWNAPLLPIDTLAQLLGLTLPLTPPLEAQVQFAAAAVSRMIRGYIGRCLIAGQYVEEFSQPRYAPCRWEGDAWHLQVQLLEWPVEEIAEVSVGGTVLMPAQYRVHHSLGRLYVRWGSFPGWPGADYPPIRVTYQGGFDPLPQSVAAVMVSLTRSMLAGMGAALPPVQPAPVKAVTVGALKVDYAVATVPPAGGAAGTGFPLAGGALDAYGALLDEFKSHRLLVATG